MVNQGVRDRLGGYQDEGEDGERDLEELRTSLAGGGRLGSPLRRRPGAQRANAPDDVEVDEGAEGRGDHHGDSDCVLMKPDGGRAGPEGRDCQRAEANGNADPAEGDDGRAGALQNDEDEAGGSEEPGPSAFGSGSRGRRRNRGARLKGHLFLKL